MPVAGGRVYGHGDRSAGGRVGRLDYDGTAGHRGHAQGVDRAHGEHICASRYPHQVAGRLSRERVGSGDLTSGVEVQEVAFRQFGQHLRKVEWLGVPGQGGTAGGGPGARERSQHGLMYGSQAAQGRRDPAPAGASQRIQPRRIFGLGSGGHGLPDRPAELAGGRRARHHAVVIAVQPAGQARQTPWISEGVGPAQSSVIESCRIVFESCLSGRVTSKHVELPAPGISALSVH